MLTSYDQHVESRGMGGVSEASGAVGCASIQQIAGTPLLHTKRKRIELHLGRITLLL